MAPLTHSLARRVGWFGADTSRLVRVRDGRIASLVRFIHDVAAAGLDIATGNKARGVSYFEPAILCRQTMIGSRRANAIQGSGP